MTIRNTFKISSAIYVTLTTVVISGLIYQLGAMHDAVNKMVLSSKIMESVYELQLLVYDQLEEPGLQRVTQQWGYLNEKLESDLKKALEEEGFDERRINLMRHEKKRAQVVFSEGFHLLNEKSDQRMILLGGILSNRLALLASEAHKFQTHYEGHFGAVKRNSEYLVMTLVIIALLVTLLNSNWIDKRVLSPLSLMTQEFQKIDAKTLDHVVQLDSPDEFRQLAREFNRMTSDLRTTYIELNDEIDRRTKLESELIEHKKNLEKTVIDRTQELAQTNAQLRSEVQEREKAQRSLLDYVARIDKMNTELSQFSYISSHHLQEPLRKIVNFGELLERKTDSLTDEKSRRYVNHIVDNSKRMKTLIEDLILFINIDNSELAKEHVDSNTIVQKALASLDREIRKSSAKITVQHLPALLANPRELELVFVNIIENSLKFRKSERPQIRIWSENRNGEWIIAISDNGIGLEQDYAEKIFEIFQRLHTTDKYPGTGVGLALCKKIIERHGGKIWVESALERGATFRFTVPMISSLNC